MTSLQELERRVREAEVDVLRADEGAAAALAATKARWSARLPWVAGLGAAGLAATLFARARPRAAEGRMRNARRAGLLPEFAAPLVQLLVRRASAMALIAVAGATAKRPAKPLTTVAHVDLARYAGRWYEVARLPLSHEEKCERDVTATYEPTDDGLRVVNRCRRADGRVARAVGRARVVDRLTPARLQVSFAPALLDALPFVWSDYWIIDLADDYSAALVGTPDRKHLWLLARTPTLPGSTLAAFIARAQQQGFDTAKLSMTEHGVGPAAARAANEPVAVHAAE
jgi:apolipoprotein D and lipocalin family protein